MPFDPQILYDLAATGANITIDASNTRIYTQPLIKGWATGAGKVTIKNAGIINSNELIIIAQALRDRLTLEE